MFNKSNDEHQLAQRYEREPMTKKYKVFYAIYQVLLLHQGSILEFTLSMKADISCYEIDQIILHLSMKNTLKKLTLDLRVTDGMYYLPPSFFSLQQLTDLSLRKCMLDLEPTFSRLGNFTSLSLIDVQICRETFLHLISTSPLLKRLSMKLWDEGGRDVLDVDPFELFKCVPVIEHLSLWCWTFTEFQLSAQGVVPLELPTKLVHLRSLCLFDMLFVDNFHILALFILIRSSPKLEKLKLEQEFRLRTNLLMYPKVSLDDYSDIWLGNLHELEIETFFNLKPELEFVKLILAKSPVLKKVRIQLTELVRNDEELMILRTITRFRRASPFAEIIVERP